MAGPINTTTDMLDTRHRKAREVLCNSGALEETTLRENFSSSIWWLLPLTAQHRSGQVSRDRVGRAGRGGH